ncbi:MAG TPA: 3-phosphoshikimate 1-carboxyvinyltransferase [Polyangiaceae bacterium]|nr:3-phosphoshikimate 1-carboxyvinyltransferase [Polyangiaceae bacterium]
MSDSAAKILVHPLSGAPKASVRVPGSKSYTNRALICAALAEGHSVLDGALFSDDTQYMAEALRALGLTVEAAPNDYRLSVQGCGGVLPAREVDLFVGNAGTAARFLAVMLCLGKGKYRLDGVPRMRERPMGPLLGALRRLGAQVEELGSQDCLPVRLSAARTAYTGATLSLPGTASSQFFSGLLLSAPYLGGVRLNVEGRLVSQPYLDMTAQVMSSFGVTLRNENYQRFVVNPGHYHAAQYQVEPDASAASYFFAAAAITGGEVTVEGLGSDSLQGDLGFVRILEQMGAKVEQSARRTTVTGPQQLRGVEVDMRDLSDTAQTLAVVAPFATSPTRITGIGFIRAKETDRVGAVVRELNRLGIDAVEEPDGMLIKPGKPNPGEVSTYHDHRMAMSFALLGLKHAGIEILDPACTSKTFPTYFKVLDELRTMQ